jgi:predicted RNase H-like nuclease (RuvC/YqgF family)
MREVCSQHAELFRIIIETNTTVKLLTDKIEKMDTALWRNIETLQSNISDCRTGITKAEAKLGEHCRRIENLEKKKNDNIKRKSNLSNDNKEFSLSLSVKAVGIGVSVISIVATIILKLAGVI